jgi:peptidoglycan hydrolase-like protein with peptidoglycan-binding domain
MSMSDRSSGIPVVVVLALVAPLVAAGLWVFAASSESPLESAAQAEPLVGSVERAERSGETTVSVKIEYADALAPTTQASGTITALAIAAGAEVSGGEAVMAVDAKDVIAYASPAPLYRDVARRSEGADVAAAQQLLINLGYLDGDADGVAGYATEQAIEAFNRAHGYGKDNPVLSRTALVWIGPGPVTVSEMQVALGEAVSPGTELFTTAASLARIVVTETASLPRDVEVELEVMGITTPYEVGTSAVTDPDAVAAIAEALGSAAEGVGTVRLTTPVTVGTVPASAVVSDETGRACLFPDVTGPAIVVEPLGGTLGTVDLDASLVGQAVLLNPREVRGDLTCD